LMGAMLVPVGTAGLFLLSGGIERGKLHQKGASMMTAARA